MRYLALAFALLAAPASAADLKPLIYKTAPATAPASYNWSGFYVTGKAAYGVNFTGMTTNASTTIGGLSADLASSPHGWGAGGGVQLLYQGQASPWVLGLRAVINYMALSAGSSVTNPTGASFISISNATNYLGDANVVLGYTLDPRLLAYVSGGFAFGGAHPNLTAAGNCFTVSGNCAAAAADTSVGYDIGAGLDWAATQWVDVFVEGQYSHLGGKSLSIVSFGGTPLVTSSAAYDIFKQEAGLRLKLWSPN